MQNIKLVIIKVGVALCVAPFFSVALAQQGNTQTQLLLELQAMRQEIAELRDMVERQQYQLRKLQQSQKQISAPETNHGVPTANQYPQTIPDSNTGAVYDHKFLKMTIALTPPTMSQQRISLMNE